MPLGIVPHNENTTDGMVEILKHVHTYVPCAEDGGCQIPFGGDQLTACRARKCQSIRVNSTSPTDALRGVIPFAADWHAKVIFMDVSDVAD